MNRQELFKHSLIRAGMQLSEFARTLEVTSNTIHHALNGNGSPKINTAIDEFINEQIPILFNALKDFQPLRPQLAETA